MGELRLESVQDTARLRILLVEDDPGDAELVQACLEEAERGGAQIVRAGSLADGLRTLDEQDIHLVVLDLDLPDSAGFDTLERLAAAASGPLIVVTGNPHPGLVDESLKRRAYDVIRKTELDAASLMRIVRLATLQSRTEVLARRRTEEALAGAQAQARRMSLMYAALSAANEASARLESESALYQRICEIAVEFGGMRLAAVRLLDRASGWLETAGCAGEAAPYVHATRMCVDAGLPEGQGLAGEAMRENRIAVCNDFLAEPRLKPWHEMARKFAFRAVACVPLRRGGAAVGLLMLYSGERGWFDGELVTLVERMAANLDHALDRLDAQYRTERVSRMYAALSAANEAILRAASAEELLARVCDIAVASGDFTLGTVFMLDRASGLLDRVAASGPGAEEHEHLRPSVDASHPGGRGLIGEACRTRVPVVSNDYENDPRASGRQQARSYRVRSAAVFPLLVDGEVAGVFGLLHGERNVFGEDLTVLLQRLADNIAFGLANFRREQALQSSLERFGVVVHATNDVIWDWNLRTGEVWWNENFQTVFGYAPHEVGNGYDAWISRLHPEDMHRVQSSIAQRRNIWHGEYRFRRRDGSYAIVHDRGLLLRDAAGEPVRMIGAMTDITERKSAERRIARHAQRQEIIARLGQLALGAVDLDSVLAQAVRAVRHDGIDAAVVNELLPNGQHLVRAASGEGSEASAGRAADPAPDSVWRDACGKHAVLRVDATYLRTRPPDRPWAWTRRMGAAIYVTLNREQGVFGVLAVYSSAENAFAEEDERFVEAVANVLSAALRRHETQMRLAYMAEFDALTGLPNRQLLQDRLSQGLAQAQRRGGQGAVLFIDLDRFKLVNDTLGHHLGDLLITEVGRRIRQCVRAVDTVGRVSGDEFGVLLNELGQPDDAALVAQKIIDALAQPFDLDGNEAFVTASIGISVFPADGVDAETLIKNADMAMYRVKESTRNAHCFFTGEMNERSVAKLQLYTDLRRAIERREFVLHYQPQVHLGDRRVLAREALLRWNHPSRGLIGPADFVPALEDSGLIVPVGEWVLGEAAAQLARWQRAGRAPVPVAVNLSARQFRRRDLDTLIQRTLAAAGMPVSLIEIEITESSLMEDAEEAVRLLRSLRAAGISISLDDFGTGYSSLSYLTRLPLNAVKIDRSFVRDAASSAESASIVRAIIDMAHNLHFTVVAEGVETEAQLAFLRKHGCDAAQGYLFGRPTDASLVAG
jgi:diguanylate cyclase (GGDEF)-like protein/PAS domain S-box-containing protein